MPQLQSIARCRATRDPACTTALACAASAATHALSARFARSRARASPNRSPSPARGIRRWSAKPIREPGGAGAREWRAAWCWAFARRSRAIRDAGASEQSFGEDPYLVGELGVAAIEGLQGSGKPHALAAGQGLRGRHRIRRARPCRPKAWGPRRSPSASFARSTSRPSSTRSAAPRGRDRRRRATRSTACRRTPTRGC